MAEDMARELYEKAWLEKQRLEGKPIVYPAAGRCEARQTMPEMRCMLPYGHAGKHKFKERGL